MVDACRGMPVAKSYLRIQILGKEIILRQRVIQHARYQTAISEKHKGGDMETVITTESNEHAAGSKETGSRRPRILLAEDDQQIRTMIESALQDEGYETVVCLDGLDLLDRVDSFFFPVSERSETFDLIIADLHLPVVSGMEILEGMQHIEGFPPMILISRPGMDQTGRDAQKLGAVSMFESPFEQDALLSEVHQLCDGLQPDLRFHV